MGKLGFPASQLPRGWFIVSRSHELKAGDVKPLEYYGEHLVLWRGDSGAVFLQDAFCLHLGAHRGVKGWVTGDDLNCPWHGWVWDGAGKNTKIPYSTEGCKPRLQTKTYPAREWCGYVVAWLDWKNEAPYWELPEIPEYSDPDYYPMHPVSDLLYRVKAHPQMPIENACDAAHIPLVHGAGSEPILTDVGTNGHIFRSTAHISYGRGKKSTKLTPDGPIESAFENNVYGIGIAVVFWRTPGTVPSWMITGFTPTGDGHIDYYFSFASKREEGDTGDEPTGRALEMLKMQHKVIPQDFFTWENMTYLDRPSFAVEEAKDYAMFRRWAAQFYPEQDQEALARFAGA